MEVSLPNNLTFTCQVFGTKIGSNLPSELLDKEIISNNKMNTEYTSDISFIFNSITFIALNKSILYQVWFKDDSFVLVGTTSI